jgi:hypothetical protein
MGEQALSVWSASILLEEADDVPGYQNVGQYFTGSVIQVYGAIPVDSTGQPVVKVGDKVDAHLRMGWATYSAYWWTWDYHRTSEYPASAYQFSCSTKVEGPKQVQLYDPEFGSYYWATKYEIFYSVSGNVSPFAIHIARINMYGYDITFSGDGAHTGPASGSIIVDPGDSIAIYANPDPKAKWGQYTWEYDNWKLIGSAATPRP